MAASAGLDEDVFRILLIFKMDDQGFFGARFQTVAAFAKEQVHQGGGVGIAKVKIGHLRDGMLDARRQVFGAGVAGQPVQIAGQGGSLAADGVAAPAAGSYNFV